MKHRTPSTEIRPAIVAPALPVRWRRWLASDLWYDFVHSPVTVLAAAIALVFVAINLVVDLLYAVVDPRLRVHGARAGGRR